ncbi:MAG TPA: hypothetical protein VK217_11170 [Acidimicrobiales bacterium]|nr:hypothetical protein [Acidimicrobiales bacterium]
MPSRKVGPEPTVAGNIVQEHWHGEALAAVLAARDEPHGAARVELMRGHLGLKDELRPMRMGAGGLLAG